MFFLSSIHQKKREKNSSSLSVSGLFFIFLALIYHAWVPTSSHKITFFSSSSSRYLFRTRGWKKAQKFLYDVLWQLEKFPFSLISWFAFSRKIDPTKMNYNICHPPPFLSRAKLLFYNNDSEKVKMTEMNFSLNDCQARQKGGGVQKRCWEFIEITHFDNISPLTKRESERKKN
jgi:hypothetical protein